MHIKVHDASKCQHDLDSGDFGIIKFLDLGIDLGILFQSKVYINADLWNEDIWFIYWNISKSTFLYYSILTCPCDKVIAHYIWGKEHTIEM